MEGIGVLFALLLFAGVVACKSQPPPFVLKLERPKDFVFNKDNPLQIYEDIDATTPWIKSYDNKYKRDLDYLKQIRYSPQRDTVFLLERTDMLCSYSATIWSKMDTVSYSRQSDGLIKKNGSIYTKYMMKLVSEWNLTEIKKESQKYLKLGVLDDNSEITATRIIFYQNGYRIDRNAFADFYDDKRDCLDFYE